MALESLAWPASRLGEAIEALARMSGLGGGTGDGAATAFAVKAGEESAGWIVAAASRLGLEAEPVETALGDLEALLRNGPPLLLRLPGEERYLLLLKSGGRRLKALGPSLSRQRLHTRDLLPILTGSIHGPFTQQAESILQSAGFAGSERERVRAALLPVLLHNERLGGAWLIRPTAGASLRMAGREARLGRLLGLSLGAYACQYLLWIFSWRLLSLGAMEGRLDRGWLLGWALLLMTAIPFRILGLHAGGLFSIRASAWLKRRFLAGALRLEPDEVRRAGTGQLLGQVMESEAVEAMAVSGGLQSFTALLELAISAWVLAYGAGGWLSELGLALVAALFVWAGLRQFRRRRQWTDARLRLTHDLVENMVGHRTRLVQEPRQFWNEGEDRGLEAYLKTSQALDGSAAALADFLPRFWFILGILSLAPAYVSGSAALPAMVFGIGGTLLAYSAFRRLAAGLEQALEAAASWERAGVFFKAAERPETLGRPEFAAGPFQEPPAAASEPTAPDANGAALLEAHDLAFRFSGRAEAALNGVDLRILKRERLLLEGSAGCGKSTLGSLLSGCRAASSGLLLLGGFDRDTLGDGNWRRRVVLAPQFHENHVFMGTLAFNLLMGRGWPPGVGDALEALAILRGLELGALVERMPGGLAQLVGETGWQLSHGERSRLFIARALLQGGDLLILDESFAALDPETLKRVLTFVLNRPEAILVIAHP